MALSLTDKILTTFDINTGETLTVNDYTGLYDATLNPGGYGSPNIDQSSVNATRWIFSSYLQEINTSTSTVIEAGREYIVSVASFSYDTRTYNIGDVFISMLSGTPTLGNAVLTTTGRFSSASSFLPSQVQSGDLTPSLTVGISDLIYPDSSYSLEYSIYTTKKVSGDIPADGTYIVGGTPGQTVTWNGITYRVNELITVAGAHALTGTGFIALLYATATANFQLSYYSQQSKITLELKVAGSSCGWNAQATEALEQISNDLCAIEDNFNDNLDEDNSGTQILLDEIASIYQQNV